MMRDLSKPRQGDWLVWPDGSERRIKRVIRHKPSGFSLIYENENSESGETLMVNADKILNNIEVTVVDSVGNPINWETADAGK